MGSDSSKPSTSSAVASKYTPSTDTKPAESEPKSVSPAPEPAAAVGAQYPSSKEEPKMAMLGLEEQLREMLECKICFDDKEKQKLLPCQHTICLDCLKKLEIKHASYKCPLCNREMPVPNGGFETLPESLITKQLAHLIKPRPEGRGGLLSPRPRAAAGSSSMVSTEIHRKINENIDKGKQALETSKTKIKSCSSMLDDLEQTASRMKTSINNLMEQTMDKLIANAARKVQAIDELTQKKKDELLDSICKLSDANTKAQRGLELLERRATNPQMNLRQTMMADEVQNTQTTLKDLEEMLLTLDSVSSNFRAGDSVRLRMDESLLTSEFLLSELNHYSIGFIHQVDDDGDCAVIFPENSRWTGNISSLEKSSTPHRLPVIGDRVKVKDSVTTPHFKWGMVKRGSIGILTEMKNTGPSQGRQVEVDFPEDHDWTALYDELELIPSKPLEKGDNVWIASHISEPARGWAGVTPTSIGTLVSVNGGEVEVNFPECNNWKGLLAEIERTRPITIGDRVRVKRSVTEPKFAWGGVDHEDVGKVAKIMNSAEHGQVVKVDFPNRLGLWQCLLSEIEIVTRLTKSEAPTTRRRSSDLQCPTQ